MKGIEHATDEDSDRDVGNGRTTRRWRGGDRERRDDLNRLNRLIQLNNEGSPLEGKHHGSGYETLGDVPQHVVRTFTGRGLAVVAAAALAGCGAAATRSTSSSASPASLTVVARGLANPRQMSFGADGALYVAEAGAGGRLRCARAAGSGTRICLGDSGSIARIKGGELRRVVTGLPSVAAASGEEASGPADVIVSHGRLAFVVQDTDIDAAGANQFGRAGRELGQLATSSLGGGSIRMLANLALFEAKHNPDHGAGPPGASSIDSDPYGLVAYRGGYAVADAAANDVLWVSRRGDVRVLAVLPVQSEPSSAAHSSTVISQSVPTSLAVGRDGALYVGELTGDPSDRGYAKVWRITPAGVLRVYASGFTNISAITFDRQGRLLVLEIDRAGLTHPNAPGELIRLNSPTNRTVLGSKGLTSASGVAVAPDGSIYLSINGTATGNGPGATGEVVRLR